MNKIITLLILLALMACKSTKTAEKSARKASIDQSNNVVYTTDGSSTTEKNVSVSGQSQSSGLMESTSASAETDSVNTHRVELNFSAPDSAGKQHVVKAIITDETRHRKTGKAMSQKASSTKNENHKGALSGKSTANNKSELTDKTKQKNREDVRNSTTEEKRDRTGTYIAWIVIGLVILLAGLLLIKR